MIDRSLDDVPEPELPSAVRAVLAELDAEALIACLDELVQAGMPWLTETGRRRVQLMAFPHPKAGGVRLPSEDVLTGPADWRIYLAALGHPAAASAGELGAVLPGLPLAVVDDLIDLGLVGRSDLPWRRRTDGLERAYLLARLAPDKIGRAEAAALNWAEMERRHRFLDGEDLEDGDDLLALLTAFWRGEPDISLRTRLTPAARTLYDRITVGAQTGVWPRHIVADRGLWALLAALWTPSGPINPELSGFHAWRALYNCYRWLLMGWFDKVRPQLQRLLKAAETAAEDIADGIRTEIYNMGAYLAQETNELEFAIKLLRSAQELNPAASANLALVEQRRNTVINDRDHWENPYLMLGVPHGDPDWENQWRALRKQLHGDLDRLTLINAAKRRLMHAERNGGRFFVLPLDESVLVLPRRRSAVLLPEPEPISRRTPPSGPEELADLRARAIRSLLGELTPNAPIS
ncbi:hypothetical protein [Thermomonospora amylolytica]|uniref:hypothetical protein n=1 Tax=Thermomonospora amylolytica TaxID=1411117 RepID=UPI001F46EAB0|nr:hypothetical protein [Thermomonospora amylolytica]